MTEKTGFKAAKKFFDTTNFPHGFNRSGDFTVKESLILTEHGTRLNDLSTGQASPETAEEERFLEVFNSRDNLDRDIILTKVEKTWLKYWKISHEFKRTFGVVDRLAKGSLVDDDFS